MHQFNVGWSCTMKSSQTVKMKKENEKKSSNMESKNGNGQSASSFPTWFGDQTPLDQTRFSINPDGKLLAGDMSWKNSLWLNSDVKTFYHASQCQSVFEESTNSCSNRCGRRHISHVWNLQQTITETRNIEKKKITSEGHKVSIANTKSHYD